MISLRDEIEIDTSPRQFFEWLERMPKEYMAWHLDHVACKMLLGSMLEVGSEMECQEYLHGKLHTMRFCMMKVISDERIEFVIEGMGRGAFAAVANEHGIVFVAELNIGSDTPIIGDLFDFIFRMFFKNRIDEMKIHMVEEGQNLKALLEAL
ncbi:MAG: hypothetical protein ISR58_10145 [Anaerolineales bacterium]|nr:hypothetical protein [Anaerolineales bacterium]